MDVAPLGVPRFEAHEFGRRGSDYCLMIPVINENGRLKAELERAAASGIGDLCDIVVLDGGSTDGSVAEDILRPLGVNALLMKLGPGRQGAQLRMGFHWALLRGYEGFITIDGNNKDSIEDAPRFIEKLREGYDLIQGSRYLKGGRAINTPPIRHLAVRLIHAPITSLAAGRRFTDSTNAFRGYSRRYISHPQTDIFRDLFDGYELLAYLSARATRLGLRACEIPVTRAYPPRDSGRPPTKISPVRGSASLLAILLKNLFGAYNPRPGKAEQKDG